VTFVNHEYSSETSEIDNFRRDVRTVRVRNALLEIQYYSAIILIKHFSFCCLFHTACPPPWDRAIDFCVCSILCVSHKKNRPEFPASRMRFVFRSKLGVMFACRIFQQNLRLAEKIEKQYS